jgi:hypothetical protein
MGGGKLAIDCQAGGVSLEAESGSKGSSVQAVQSPSLILPRVAGEEIGEGWNDWNF